MISIFAKPMGALMHLIYSGVSFLDSTYISSYAIAIILSTIILKLVLLPLTIKQTKSMKKMQDLNPKLQELQKKYKNDPQTLQRKTMEIYKENNANPMSGCLLLLIQFPILIAFFYVLRDPVQYMFHDQAIYDALNKSFLWIKDLGYASNYIFEDGIVNGLSMGGISLPFVGAALPILAFISAFTTYYTSKMTQSSQAVANEQQKATQNTMTIMMPIMIFVFALQFPAGLALYWVVSNIFQLAQQIIIFNKSQNLQEELK